jgi:hypothetical protein
VNARLVPTETVAAAWLLLAICAASGCSRGESAWQRVSVTGTVNYQGQAVTDGSISLRPISETGGPAAGAAIRDGRFEIPEEQGPTAGMYQAKLLVPVGDLSASATGKSRFALQQIPNMRQFERSVKLIAGSNTLRNDLK